MKYSLIVFITFFSFGALAQDYLGTGAAKKIVSDCADSICWACEGIPSPNCLAAKLEQAGYAHCPISPRQIPANAKLYEAVIDLQYCQPSR